MKAEFVRDHAVVVRMTKTEKQTLERYVRAGKYRSVSEFLRLMIDKLTKDNQ
jgi:Arc/MetJ-type ribon-helix-helix transcriptional regulator